MNCICFKKTRRAAEDWTFHGIRGLRGPFNTAGKTILALSAFVVAAAFAATGKGTLAAGVFLITAAFAASDDFHQSFVSTRTASAHDVMIDCAGAFTAVLLCWMFARARSPQTVS